MRRIYFMIICSFGISIILSGCSRDGNEPAPKPETVETHQPGSIPGLGEKPGELTGTPFKLPENIVISGKILGGFELNSYDRSLKSRKQSHLPLSSKIITKVESGSSYVTIGCGTYVSLYIVLKNTGNSEVQIIFPAGLIAKSLSGNSQNGVLLKKSSIKIGAKSTKYVLLMMFCGNAHLGASSVSEEYKFSVVSNSSLIIDLCNRLKNKKINIEEYNVKSIWEVMANHDCDWTNFDWSEYYPTKFEDYKFQIQEILWNLTDYGISLSEDNIQTINNMENSR